MQTDKLTARVDELEELVKRLMILLVQHSPVTEGQALCDLWAEYQDVCKQIGQDFSNSVR